MKKHGIQPNYDKALSSLRVVVHNRASSQLEGEESLLSLSRVDSMDGSLRDDSQVNLPMYPVEMPLSARSDA